LVSLAGLPPAMLGLFAKVRVIAEPVGAGSVVLAVLLALAVLVGVAAYLRWLVPALQAGSGRVSVPIGVSAAGVIAAVVLVVGSVAPEWVLGLG
jgi:NADH-quinone oxidoreductase subunit N